MRERTQREAWLPLQSEGITLLEVIMAMALVALVVAGIYGGFVLAAKRAQRAQARAIIQQNVRVVIDNVARELRETSSAPAGVAVYNCPGTACAVGYVTARNAAGSFQVEPDPAQPTYGQPQWQGVVYLYRDGPELRRRVDYTTTVPALVPPAPSPADPSLLNHVQEVEFGDSGATVHVRIVALDRNELTSIQTNVEPENP